MRTIEQTGQFKRDYKREAKGSHRQTLAKELIAIVTDLANDQSLPEKNRDHALSGDWKDHRVCHIKPDLVLIYRKPDNAPDNAVLQLVRLGSHSELGL
jgi:mRNA interferase YafQ